LIREPGGTPIGEQVRKILLEPGNHKMSPKTEALLYAASRAQLVEEIIRPNLEKGVHILCDRFVLSSLAYQGWGRNLGISSIRMINDFGTGGLSPHVTLFFRVDPAHTLKRKTAGKADRMEQLGDDFHRKVYEGYEIVSRDVENVAFIAADGTVEEVYRQCMDVINERLGAQT
jgi:dTMP kinase